MSLTAVYLMFILPITYALALIIAGMLSKILFSTNSEKLKLVEIDGLRGLLAISVLIHHYTRWLRVSYMGESWISSPINIFNQLGSASVGLFFMATGLVFYPRVLNGFFGTNWASVYVLRLFRIVPLVFLSVATVSLIAWWHGDRKNLSLFMHDFLTWITTYAEPDLLGLKDTGRVNAYVLWSLWYEWLFYFLVLPATSFAIDCIRGRAPTWIVPLGIGFGAFFLRKAGVPGQILAYLPLFSIGMLAFEAQRREFMRTAFKSPTATITAVLLLLFAAVASSTPYGWSMPLFGIFFVCVACGNGMLGLFRSSGSVLLGNISFSIYLLHGIVEYLLFTTYGNRISVEEMSWMLPVTACAITLIAFMTYTVVETPMMLVGKRIARTLVPVAAWNREKALTGPSS